jgi:serine phosphatase RsbU (regulator of sigma subunit)
MPQASRHKAVTAVEAAQRIRALEEEIACLRREHDDFRRTMFEAAQAQRRLCGPRKIRRHGVQIATEIFPVRHLSGDFVSTLELGDEFVFAIGDIAGKGLAAAMWFTHVLELVRLHAHDQASPADAARAINRDLCRAQSGAPLATLFLARLNVTTGRMQYCNAGHPPTLLLRGREQTEMLVRGGPLLGAVPEGEFLNGECTMNSGDTLFAYSDGVLETRNPAGHEFGIEGLLSAARRTAEAPAHAALFSVLAVAEDFSSGHPREDDIALVVVRRD